MSVMEFARTDVVTAGPEATLEEIAHTMCERRVGSVVVLDDEGRPAGIVTDRDLVTYGLAGDRDPADVIANDVMAFDVFVTDADDDVHDVISGMADAGVRRAPLVDGDDRLVGIVTLDDLVIMLSEELRDLASVVEGESPPRPR